MQGVERVYSRYFAAILVTGILARLAVDLSKINLSNDRSPRFGLGSAAVADRQKLDVRNQSEPACGRGFEHFRGQRAVKDCKPPLSFFEPTAQADPMRTVEFPDCGHSARYLWQQIHTLTSSTSRAP